MQSLSESTGVATGSELTWDRKSTTFRGSGRWGQAMWDFTHIASLVVKGLCFGIAGKILYQWEKTKQTGL